MKSPCRLYLAFCKCRQSSAPEHLYSKAQENSRPLNPPCLCFMMKSFRLPCVALNCQTSWDISCLCYRQDKEVIMEKCGDQSGLFNPLEAQFHFLTSKSLNRTTCPLLAYSPAFPAGEFQVSSV